MVTNQPRYAMTYWILNRYISTQIFSTELVNQNIQIYYHPAIIVRKVDSVDHPVTLSLKRNKQFKGGGRKNSGGGKIPYGARSAPRNFFTPPWIVFTPPDFFITPPLPSLFTHSDRSHTTRYVVFLLKKSTFWTILGHLNPN